MSGEKEARRHTAGRRERKAPAKLGRSRAQTPEETGAVSFLLEGPASDWLAGEAKVVLGDDENVPRRDRPSATRFAASALYVLPEFPPPAAVHVDEDVQAIISNIGRRTQPSSEPAPAPATSGEAKAHVSEDFPPRAVVNADVDVLAAGLSSLAVETLGDEGRRRLVAAFRAVMTYDVTQDPVWEKISKLGRSTRLYMCDPEPKSFVMEDGQRITGRGSILVDYRAEILPGQERDVSVSVPARFHLHCRNGVPEIDRVELRD